MELLHLAQMWCVCTNTGTNESFMPAVPAPTYVYIIANMSVANFTRPPITLNFSLCVVNIVHLSRILK